MCSINKNCIDMSLTYKQSLVQRSSCPLCGDVQRTIHIDFPEIRGEMEDDFGSSDEQGKNYTPLAPLILN